GEYYHSQDGFVVQQPHRHAPQKPRNSVSGIKQAKSRASFLRWNNASKHRLKQRALSAHPDSPKNHSNQCKGRSVQKNEWSCGGRNQKGEQRHIRTEPIKQSAQRNGCKGAGRHRNCIEHWDQVSRHDVRFLKMKTDQCEIGEPRGKQCACHEIDPVPLLQVSRCKCVSGAFFQLMRTRVKKPRQCQSRKTKQSWKEEVPKTGLIAAIEEKYQRNE